MHINNEERKLRQMMIFNVPEMRVRLYTSVMRQLHQMKKEEAINHANSLLKAVPIDGTPTIAQKAAKDWLEIFSGVNKD
jgi:uncharacterized protein YdaT